MTSVAFDGMGRKMVTAGVDGQVRVWDVRTFKPLHSYFSHAPATSLEISQQGLLAVGFGTRVQASSCYHFDTVAFNSSTRRSCGIRWAAGRPLQQQGADSLS